MRKRKGVNYPGWRRIAARRKGIRTRRFKEVKMSLKRVCVVVALVTLLNRIIIILLLASDLAVCCGGIAEKNPTLM